MGLRAFLSMVRLHFPLIFACIFLGACDEGPRFTSSVQRSSEVDVGRALKLNVDVPIELIVEGEISNDKVIVDLDLTLSATAASTADQVAKSFAPNVESNDDARELSIKIEQPEHATGLSGKVTFRTPRVLSLNILQRFSTVIVKDMKDKIAIESASNVEVRSAESDVNIKVNSGNILVDTRASSGTTAEVYATQGNIDILLPTLLNASLKATVDPAFVIQSAHPKLPLISPGQSQFQTTVGTALASVSAQTLSGGIRFLSEGAE